MNLKILWAKHIPGHIWTPKQPFWSKEQSQALLWNHDLVKGQHSAPPKSILPSSYPHLCYGKSLQKCIPSGDLMSSSSSSSASTWEAPHIKIRLQRKATEEDTHHQRHLCRHGNDQDLLWMKKITTNPGWFKHVQTL